MTLSFAIGVGCRRGCPVGAVLAVIRAACATLDLQGAGLFTIEAKRDEVGLREAAAALDLPLVFLQSADLAQMTHRVIHRSHRAEVALGVPSVAEAAALVGAGKGGRLLVPRVAHAMATCAVAVTPEIAV